MNRPTKAFVEEVVKDLQSGEKGECPICLESVDDAVLTPCAHSMCRDCLYASWRSYGGGPCPICRYFYSSKLFIRYLPSYQFLVSWKLQA